MRPAVALPPPRAAGQPRGRQHFRRGGRSRPSPLRPPAAPAPAPAARRGEAAVAEGERAEVPDRGTLLEPVSARGGAGTRRAGLSGGVLRLFAARGELQAPQRALSGD